MNNQTRNHLNLQKHIADQDHIIRVRNAEIAALRKRAEKAEQERDEARDAWEGAVESVKEANSLINSLRAAESRPFTPDDITDEMVERARRSLEDDGWIVPEDCVGQLADALTAALTEAPEDPEVVALAEVLGDFAVADEHTGTRDDMQLARLLHRRGVRVVTEEQQRTTPLPPRSPRIARSRERVENREDA